MTTLVLTMVRGPTGAERQTRHVSSGYFQLGRAPWNDWVIDDPFFHVSKRHCVFRQDDDGWLIVDTSRNGSFITQGGHTHRLGAEPYRLLAGERLSLGGCEIEIGLEEDEASFQTWVLDGSHPAPMSWPPDVPSSQTVQGSRLQPVVNAGLTRDGPTRARPNERQSYAGALAVLLEGASLAPSDVEAPGNEREVLRRAGAMLRTAVGEIRQLRTLLLDETGRPRTAVDTAVAPLILAADERDALCCLLAPDRRLDVPSDRVIAAAFTELRQHHEHLVRAARRAMRSMFESLEPDERDRHVLAHWLDAVPGWRRARNAARARRRYREMRAALGETVDQMLARAYRETCREAGDWWGRK